MLERENPFKSFREAAEVLSDLLLDYASSITRYSNDRNVNNLKLTILLDSKYNANLFWDYIYNRQNKLNEILTPEINKKKESLDIQADKLLSNHKSIEKLRSEFNDLTSYSETYDYVSLNKKGMFDTEYEWFLANRDSKHHISDYLLSQGIAVGKTALTEIKKIDTKVKRLALSGFSYEPKLWQVRPRSMWWWHLHEIDKLSNEDLETI
jgi:hypothetical protein